jgi:hypothetical protein
MDIYFVISMSLPFGIIFKMSSLQFFSIHVVYAKLFCISLAVLVVCDVMDMFRV